MEAGELAATLAERDHAVEAADETDIELRSRPGAQEFAQLLLDLRGRAFQMRRQPRVDALADPQQAFAQRGKLCAAALFLSDERLTYALGPSGDETPGLPIRHTD